MSIVSSSSLGSFVSGPSLATQRTTSAARDHQIITMREDLNYQAQTPVPEILSNTATAASAADLPSLQAGRLYVQAGETLGATFAESAGGARVGAGTRLVFLFGVDIKFQGIQGTNNTFAGVNMMNMENNNWVLVFAADMGSNMTMACGDDNLPTSGGAPPGKEELLFSTAAYRSENWWSVRTLQREEKSVCVPSRSREDGSSPQVVGEEEGHHSLQQWHLVLATPEEARRGCFPAHPLIEEDFGHIHGGYMHLPQQATEQLDTEALSRVQWVCAGMGWPFAGVQKSFPTALAQSETGVNSDAVSRQLLLATTARQQLPAINPDEEQLLAESRRTTWGEQRRPPSVEAPTGKKEETHDKFANSSTLESQLAAQAKLLERALVAIEEHGETAARNVQAQNRRLDSVRAHLEGVSAKQEVVAAKLEVGFLDLNNQDLEEDLEDPDGDGSEDSEDDDGIMLAQQLGLYSKSPSGVQRRNGLLKYGCLSLTVLCCCACLLFTVVGAGLGLAMFCLGKWEPTPEVVTEQENLELVEEIEIPPPPKGCFLWILGTEDGCCPWHACMTREDQRQQDVCLGVLLSFLVCHELTFLCEFLQTSAKYVGIAWRIRAREFTEHRLNEAYGWYGWYAQCLGQGSFWTGGCCDACCCRVAPFEEQLFEDGFYATSDERSSICFGNPRLPPKVFNCGATREFLADVPRGTTTTTGPGNFCGCAAVVQAIFDNPLVRLACCCHPCCYREGTLWGRFCPCYEGCCRWGLCYSNDCCLRCFGLCRCEGEGGPELTLSTSSSSSTSSDPDGYLFDLSAPDAGSQCVYFFTETLPLGLLRCFEFDGVFSPAVNRRRGFWESLFSGSSESSAGGENAGGAAASDGDAQNTASSSAEETSEARRRARLKRAAAEQLTSSMVAAGSSAYNSSRKKAKDTSFFAGLVPSGTEFRLQGMCEADIQEMVRDMFFLDAGTPCALEYRSTKAPSGPSEKSPERVWKTALQAGSAYLDLGKEYAELTWSGLQCDAESMEVFRGCEGGSDGKYKSVVPLVARIVGTARFGMGEFYVPAELLTAAAASMRFTSTFTPLKDWETETIHGRNGFKAEYVRCRIRRFDEEDKQLRSWYGIVLDDFAVSASGWMAAKLDPKNYFPDQPKPADYGAEEETPGEDGKKKTRWWNIVGKILQYFSPAGFLFNMVKYAAGLAIEATFGRYVRDPALAQFNHMKAMGLQKRDQLKRKWEATKEGANRRWRNKFANLGDEEAREKAYKLANYSKHALLKQEKVNLIFT